MGVRDLPPLRQHLEATTPSGRHYRWGEDEPDPSNVPSGLRHSSTMPGGYESCDVTLPRKPGVDYSDLERLSTIRVIGAGGDVAWEGRLERTPRVSGDQMAISPSAVGWQAHLDDDKSCREIYIDQDLTRWESATPARRIALSGRAMSDPNVQPGMKSVPALVTAHGGPWDTTALPICEAWYDAKGIPLSQLWYGWTRGQFVSGSANNHSWDASLNDTSAAVDGDMTGDLQAGGPQNGAVLLATTTTRKLATVRLFWSTTAAGINGQQYEIFWQSLVVMGNHGIPIRGVVSAGTAGLYASEIVAHAVGNWAPLLNLTVGETVLPSTFVVRQLAFLDPTTASEIIRQASRFDLQDWAVWDDKTFWWHPPGAFGRKWRARIAPAQLEETGPQVDRVWESVIVAYQDVDGSTRTVGPPGSGADSEDATLHDSDPENPANRAGIVRRDLLQMGVSTVAGAIEVGRRFLEQTKLLDTSGRARLVGHVEDDRGILHPYWRVRAGDQISFIDAADTSYRRIVRADHDRPSRTCSIDLDAPPEGLQALLERLGVVLVSLGL